MKTRNRKAWALGAGIALLVGGSVALGAGVAGAAFGGAGTSGPRASSPRFRHVALTDAQKACLVQQGVTLPTRGAGGSRPRFDQATRDKLRAAAQTCAITVRRQKGMRHVALTDAQKACLVQQGVTLPTRGAGGSRPRFDQATRDKLRAAAQTCGITVRRHEGMHRHHRAGAQPTT